MAAVPESVGAHREWLLSFVPPAEPLAFLDLGCGAGLDLVALAARHPDPSSRFIGVDCSPDALAAARAAAGADRRTEFVLADLEQEWFSMKTCIGSAISGGPKESSLDSPSSSGSRLPEQILET